MLLRCSVLAALSWVGLVLPVWGQGGLEWKWKVGDKFYVEAVTTTKQTFERMGKATTRTASTTTVTSFKVVKQEGGNFVLEQTIEGARVRSDDVDRSTAERAANRAKGVTFTVTLTPTGKIAKFEGYTSYLTKMAGTNEQAQKAVQEATPEEMFREELTTLFGFLPDKPPTPGATWKRAESVNEGPRGTLNGEVEYTYRGKAEGGEQITLTRNLSHTPPKTPAPLFKLSDVKVEPGTGTILFDPATGRLARQELTLRMQGTVAVTDSTRRTTTFGFQQETKRTLRLLDRNPLE